MSPSLLHSIGFIVNGVFTYRRYFDLSDHGGTSITVTVNSNSRLTVSAAHNPSKPSFLFSCPHPKMRWRVSRLIWCLFLSLHIVETRLRVAALAMNEFLSKMNILNLDAIGLSRAIERKEISCEELMVATLDQIELLNPRCNAIILLRDREELLHDARQADQVERKGWLHGIPIAVKDVSNAKGIPTTMGGSRLSKNFVPNFDDPFVKNMKQAGAIIIGKTNAPENGLGSHTYNDRWGTTRNPFDLSKSAGGSSGGAGVAVATRMLVLADGTDMMGSLRNPAGWNAIYSHRPTAGLIRGAKASKKNPLPYPTSTAGPMARTPADCAKLLETMSNGAFDASSVLDHGKIQNDERVRIGWLGDWCGKLPMEDGVLELCESALGALAENGNVSLEYVREEIFPLEQLWKSWNCIRFATVAALFCETFNMDILLGENSHVKDELKWEIEQGIQVSEEDLAEAKRISMLYADALDKTFDTFDILALPSAQLFPFPQEWKWPKEVGGRSMDVYHRWMSVCVPVTFGGLPCSTIPAGFGDTGLPIGLQLFGRRSEDTKTLRLAQVYHKAVDWPSNVGFESTKGSILSVTRDRRFAHVKTVNSVKDA
jgi:amidase